MKVLFITSSYPAHQDDPRGIFVHRLARGLCREGVSITVLTPGVPRTSTQETLDGVDIQRVTYWIPQWQFLATGLEGIVPNLRQRPWLVAQIVPLILALTTRALRIASAFDVIHAHWLYPAGIAGVIAARWHRRPLVMTSQGGDLNLAQQMPKLHPMVRALTRSADVCVGVSTALCDQFRALGVPQEKVTFISSAGLDLLQPYAIPQGEAGTAYQAFVSFDGFRLVYVGSLTPRKSVETLLNAHYQLERRGCRVASAIIGPGPLRHELQTIIQDRRLQNVFMIGEQPPSVVPRWMAAAHAFILPSLSEGRPNVVLEAMALGIPVVATDIPGTREVVHPGETGLLYPPRDADALAACVEKLIRDDSFRSALGQQAREYIVQEGLTTLDAVKRYQTLYQQVVIQARSKTRKDKE